MSDMTYCQCVNDFTNEFTIIFDYPKSSGLNDSMDSILKIWYKKDEPFKSKEAINMMSKEDRRILDEFKDRVRKRFSDAQIWAFGSRARGEATWESDFDLLIVLNKIDQKIGRWVRDIAWEVGFENDRVITTVLIEREQFEHGPMSESTLVDNVLREGISA